MRMLVSELVAWRMGAIKSMRSEVALRELHSFRHAMHTEGFRSRMQCSATLPSLTLPGNATSNISAPLPTETFSIPRTSLTLYIRQDRKYFMLGADILEVLQRAEKTAMSAIRRGRAGDLINGARHWINGSVTLFLTPTALTYRDLKDTVQGMAYWVQVTPWLFPSTYDIYVSGQGRTDWAFKGWLRLFAPDAVMRGANSTESVEDM
ncbi:MAG: hypothetical protein Q9220_001782 [cf. Caloplaca sp. 1 TL-2023]